MAETMAAGRAARLVARAQGVALSSVVAVAAVTAALAVAGILPAGVSWTVLTVSVAAGAWVTWWFEAVSRQVDGPAGPAGGGDGCPVLLEPVWRRGPLLRLAATPTGGGRPAGRALTSGGRPVALRFTVWAPGRAAPSSRPAQEPATLLGDVESGRVLCLTARAALLPLAPARWDAPRQLDANSVRSLPR